MKIITKLEEQIQALKLSISNLDKRILFTHWSKYGQKRFAAKDDELNFEGGVKLCQEAGGQIATPTSIEENTALTKLIKSDGMAYLGLNDRKTEGTFQDISGSPVKFISWAPGEPSNDQADKDCSVITSDGTWSVVLCTGSYTIICQFTEY
ncbi:mannose-binding protein C-like [Polypterus senegalus]|uniref:mannose-binding protein C-like n=1 Tax=Polypterus senegalus TaxID=55291 RepID=UPI001964C249|nr:mannose-binding protein C-like [Polypterus senegalus]